MNATRTGFLTLTIYVSFTTLFIWNAAVHSPAIDEVGHLPSGISHLQLGRFELYAVNPPLAESCAALPVLLYKPQVNWSGYLPSISSRSEFIVGRRFVAANGSAAPILFFLGRIALFPFSVMAMSVASRWSRSLLSNVGAVIVVLMFASCPLFLANASLITPDVTATAVGLLAIYCFRVWLKDSSWFHSFVLGLVTGLGLISKFTWCVVFPGTAVVILILNRFFDRRNFLRDVLQLGVASLVAVFVVNAAYGFDGSFRQIREFEFVCKALRQQDNVAVNNRFCGTILECLPIPLPACYVLGIDAQKRDFDFGFRSYLIGEWKHGGWWYYYIVGFLVKETIGFQLMLYSSVVHGLWDWRKWTRETVREWSLIVVPPLLIFGLVSSQTGFNHHMRYVLPAYPFLFIIAARTVTLGKFWKWFSYACLTWQAASVLWFAPHWMSYFNEAAGGPKNGHKWLVDSNIDWGQDILMLKWWQDKHPEAAELRAALFTAFDPEDIGMKYKQPAPFVKGRKDVVSNDGRRGPQAGWCAVSVCQLKGHHYSVPNGDGTRTAPFEHFTYFLDNFEPEDRIGYSIYIYHITEDEAARVRAKLLAEEAAQMRTGRPRSASAGVSPALHRSSGVNAGVEVAK